MDEVYIPLLYRLWLARFHALRLIGPQIRVMHASHVIFQARQLERGVEKWCLCSGEIMICGEAMQIYLIEIEDVLFAFVPARISCTWSEMSTL